MQNVILIYFGSGFMGNIASSLFLDTPAVGASGAIFGLLGCLLGYLAINWEELNYPGSKRCEQLIFIGIFIVIALI